MDWTRKWPIIPGIYWFFGWCWKQDRGQAKSHLVQVRKVVNGCMYVTNGHFIYKAEGADGLWAKADIPKPSDSVVKKIMGGE